MRFLKTIAIWIFPALLHSSPAPPTAGQGEHVVLLHGLCRTTRSMAKMECSLTEAGYTVHNLSYPTRKKSVVRLAEEHLAPELAQPDLKGATKIHFVTHSLGGIVLRQYLSDHTLHNLGRIVLLGPPSQGSQVVDKIGHWKIFKALNGPAGTQLGSNDDSLPNQLGPLGHDHAVIAGSCSINWINSCMIPGPDDGKVAVSHTRLPDTTTHLVLPVTHPYLMKNKRVIRNVVHYLNKGNFDDGNLETSKP
ncbi:esterase/lipase family protein [Haloferula chungangensis]|uniref:Esterase/lipase family protein n=1 Tax=Haloferula chungangensis TaxID=1048331 RepID=A0ABW2LA03_9BACT